MTSQQAKSPVRVLVGPKSFTEIEPILKDRPELRIELLNSQDQLPGVTFDVALISRDITASSTKQKIIPSTQVFYDLLLGAPDLKWVQIHSAGADRQIYLDLMKRGAIITGSSGVNAQVVMQNAMAGMLMLARHFPKMLRAQAEKRWDSLINYPLPADLARQTAIVIGRGPIGKAICRALEVFGLHVIQVGFNPTLKDSNHTQTSTLHVSDLPQILPRAQWLILACPLTPQTRNLIDGAAIDLLPEGAHVINVARGEIIAEADLIQALQRNKLGGAYLDVFASEPLDVSSPLWGMDNVIVTPHSAGHSSGNETRVLHLFVENLTSHLKGEQLKNQISANT